MSRFMQTLLRRLPKTPKWSQPTTDPFLVTIPNVPVANLPILPNCSTFSTSCCRLNDWKRPYVGEGEEALTEMDKELKRIEEIKERVKQMNEYYSQYIEEYYEVDEPEEEEETEPCELEKDHEPVKPTTKWQFITVEELYKLVQDNRAKDIVVIQLDDHQAMHGHMIICSPHNYRHSQALVERLRKHIKSNYDLSTKEMAFIRRTRQTKDWYALDLPGTIVHVMSNDARERYDLETLWGIGDVDEVDKNKFFLKRYNEEYSARNMREE